MWWSSQSQAMRLTIPLVLVALVAAAGGDSDTTDEVINRDVVIVGGGASGAHAAVKLRDMGKTIVLVEKRDKLVSQYAAAARLSVLTACRRAGTPRRIKILSPGSPSMSGSRPGMPTRIPPTS